MSPPVKPAALSIKPRRADAFKKVSYSTKLPKWLVDWLREQPDYQSIIIEESLIARHGLKPPNTPRKQ